MKAYRFELGDLSFFSTQRGKDRDHAFFLN
ncbi:hypothetical protein SCG7109_AN_00080 [Chlamydiales bacterium SCGC AG-110-M15]|nr:hypothetical protein SCG7109_AN_00080 [Chlamydiales bacterium SCGC AG-110-M15]